MLLPDGSEATRVAVRHPGAATVLPLFEEKSLLLVRQYRYALGCHTLELPAGKIDAGEQPLETAKRELVEETGHSASRWRQISRMHSSTGFTDEVLAVFLATGLEGGRPSPDDGEFVRAERLAVREAFDLQDAGKITEARTQYALMWLRWRMSRGRWPGYIR